jgi:c-di-GMP-binding flagellar brake protein YcgR
MSWDFVERRNFVRVKIPCTITLFQPRDLTLGCQTENISAGGIRVMLTKRLPISSTINLALYLSSKEPLVCQGKVVWSFARTMKDPDTILFDTGIEFSTIEKKDVKAINSVILSFSR